MSLADAVESPATDLRHWEWKPDQIITLELVRPPPATPFPERHQGSRSWQQIAQDNGLAIEFLRHNRVRRKTGSKTSSLTVVIIRGWSILFSALETCTAFEPWHDKATGKTFLRFTTVKCLHSYTFWFFSRICGWILDQTGLSSGSAFASDGGRAQELADRFDVRRFDRELDRLARLYCPVVQQFPLRVHWSMMQVEYATEFGFPAGQTQVVLRSARLDSRAGG